MISSTDVMVSSYSYGLVALSVIIAILASYVALDLAGRITASSGKVRIAWLTGGAIAMGIGIWSMHYIGMLAFQLPVPVQYDWPTVLLSLLAAIFASAVAMFVTSRTTMGLLRAGLGSLFMGGGIASMHYTGMAAMRLPATHHYSSALVSLSVFFAVAISFVALWLTFRLREEVKELDWQKIGSAIVMGAAIPVMHYTGMAAVSFRPVAMVHGDLSHAVNISSLGIMGISGVTFMVLGLAVLTSVMDRRFSAQIVREDALLRQNAARLREDAERREFILSAATIGLWEQDLTTDQVTWSDTMELIHGIRRRAFPQTRESFLKLVHPEDRPELSRAFSRSLADGSDYVREYRIIWPDRSVHWVESTARVSRDVNGRPARIVGVDRDITESKLVQAALIESERAYRSTFEGAPVGIAHVAPNGRWLRVNRRLCELLGYTSEELLAGDILSLMDPEDREREARAFQDLATGAIDRYHREKRFRRRDGSFVWTILNVAVHRDEAGRPKHMIPIVDDITERKTLEAQLRQVQKMDAIGQLAGGIAHDFNNLLTVITGFGELILEKVKTDDGLRSDVAEILNAAQSAGTLTRQLLTFSRRQTMELQILDLNAVVSGMGAMLQRLIGEHIELVTRLSPNLGFVNADKIEIEQVIMNLAVNARDAMPAGGTLTIETGSVDLDDAFIARNRGATTGRHVMVAITDTGVGMDQTVQAHLFEPFYTTKERGKGTGLGLATVYGVVRQSNGYIRVDSEVGRGSTFAVYLPRTSQPLPSQATEFPPVSLTGSETVLLVEDQAEVRHIARETLARHGYTVLEAGSGSDALSLMRDYRSPIHLLLTDVVMPGMNGRELARQVARHDRTIRVIFMSGYADGIVGSEGVLEPGLAFLQKPFSTKRLLQKVREVLGAVHSPPA